MKKLVLFTAIAVFLTASWLAADGDSPFYWNNVWCTADTTWQGAGDANNGGTAGRETPIRAQDHESGNFFEGWWSFILETGVDSAHVSAYDLHYVRNSGTMAVLDSSIARLLPSRDYVDRIFADSIKLSIFDAGLAAGVEVVIEGYEKDQTTVYGR